MNEIKVKVEFHGSTKAMPYMRKFYTMVVTFPENAKEFSPEKRREMLIEKLEKDIFKEVDIVSAKIIQEAPTISQEETEKMHLLTQQSVNEGYSNAPSTWKIMALECVRIICTRHETFTVNDVRELVNKSPLKTHDNRAMGGVIKRAQAKGWLVATGESIPSVVGHKVPIQVWRSMLYKPGESQKLF